MIITTDKEMRPRDEHDHYPTPTPLVKAALEHEHVYFRRQAHTCLDVGAGSGVWGQALASLYPDMHVTGIDIRDIPIPVAYDEWVPNTDYLSWTPTREYDVVIGNPPFVFAEEFVRRGHAQLTQNGTMVLLLRLAFLEGQSRMAGLWKELPPDHVAVCGARPSFTGDGKTDATAYAVYYWRKSRRYVNQPSLSWLDWKPAPPPKGKKRGKRETEVVVPA